MKGREGLCYAGCEICRMCCSDRLNPPPKQTFDLALQSLLVFVALHDLNQANTLF